MTDQLMSHDEAVKGMAVERYLLGEMNEEEQATFEAHYLNCAACLEAVTFAGEVMQAAEPVAREVRAAEQRSKAPARRSAGFFGLSWAPAFAMGLVVCLAGLSIYEATVIRDQKQTLAKVQAPAQEFGYVVTGESRGGQKVIAVKRGAQVSLRVEFTPDPQLTNYQADILTSANVLKYSVPLQVSSQDDSVNVSFRTDNLDSGSYKVIVHGKDATGNERTLASGAFDLQLTD
ncbi:MAG TPA: zf-HC2 domain-containing protein [Terriglobales bacterium]|nr:zf-HC2 domain-containing protein [Terriglobales bacterium]